MKKRILELYKQAYGHFPCPAGEPETERFAELIVRECMKVCREQLNPRGLNYKPSERFAEVLQQHFGVEK